MKKKKIDRDLAEIEASMQNINIQEEQFTEVVVRRGRPKKNTNNQEEPKQGKRRGRPKKETQNQPSLENAEPTITENKKNTNEDEKTNTNENMGDIKEQEEVNQRDEDELMASDNENSEEASEIEVECFEYMDTEYLRADSGEIYNKETHDMIGYWNIIQTKLTSYTN